jgi:hypothetical protein
VGLLHDIHARGDRAAAHAGWRGKWWVLANSGGHGRSTGTGHVV